MQRNPGLIHDELMYFKNTILDLFKNLLQVMLLTDSEKQGYLKTVEELFDNKERMIDKALSYSPETDPEKSHALLQIINSHYIKP